MYIIVVYDLPSEHIQKIHNVLRRYLHWVQNSVFEGELSRQKLEEMVSTLKSELLDQGAVRIYSLRSKKAIEEIIQIGEEPIDFEVV